MSPAAARAASIPDIVARLMGWRPITVAHQDFGHGSLTFRASLGGESVVVRTHHDPHTYATTEANLDVLRDIGLPVPRALAADLSQERWPFAVLILEHIPGRDLRDELPTMTLAQQRALAEQIVGYQRLVGSLPRGRGYGFCGIGETPPHSNWPAAIAADVGRWEAAMPEPYLRLGDAVHARRRDWEPLLRAVPPTCFLDDLTTKNVIVERGVLRGVIDFDCVCYGDPLYAIGLTQTAIAFDLPLQSTTYVDGLCGSAGLASHERRRVDLYSALHGLSFIARLGEGAEAERGAAAVRRWLASADP